MKFKNIKINILYGVINTIINTLFPILTFMYVARVLEPTGLGQISFATSLVNVFSIFSMLGISLYATRKTAGLRNDLLVRKKELSEIFWINGISTFLVLICYILFIFFNEKTQTNVSLYLIYSGVLIYNWLSVGWYFDGNEKFKFIAIRNLIVKVAALIALFVFVKDSNDLLIYAIICVAVDIIYSIINFGLFLKENGLVCKDLHFLRHLKPILITFVFVIIASIYTQMDNIMIGYLTSEDADFAQGIYAVGLKIPRTVLSVISVLSTILMPRFAYYFANNEEEQASNLLNKSFAICLAISLASAVGCFILSKQIVMLVGGDGYEESITISKIISPTILFIVLTNLMGIQIFYNIKKEWITVSSCAVGAVINLIINLCLIPKYAGEGAAIGTLCAEFGVLLFQVIVGWKYLKFKKFTLDNLKAIIAVAIMTIVLFVFNKMFEFALIFDIITKVSIGIVSFVLVLLILRHKLFLLYLKQVVVFIKNKFKKNHNID